MSEFILPRREHHSMFAIHHSDFIFNYKYEWEGQSSTDFLYGLGFRECRRYLATENKGESEVNIFHNAECS